MRPTWMNDPTIKDIPEEKLTFLCNMFDNVKGKSKNELMPFFMSMAKNKKQNVSFSQDEMQRIIAAIKNAATTEEKNQIDKVMQVAQQKASMHKKTDH